MKEKIKKIMVLVFAVSFLLWILTVPNDNVQEMPYTELLKNVENGNVSSIALSNGRLSADVVLKSDENVVWKVLIPNTINFMESIEESLIREEFEFSVKSKSTLITIINLLPDLIFIVIMIAMFKSLSSSININKKFKEKKDKNIKKDKVTFANVAGFIEEKNEIQEVVDFLKNPEKYENIGARMPKGVLLLGEPGCGKTLLAKATAGEANVPFISLSGSDFVELYVGIGASRVRSLFEEARKKAPCIIFIDEIDAIGAKRSANVVDSHNEREQTLNQLLVEMDGFESRKGIIVMAATNREDILDPALLRPGRFDRHITINPPDIGAREEILKLYAANKSFDETVDLKVIAQNTTGFSGADLENLVNEATILAARDDRNYISSKDLEEAMEKVMLGTEKRSKVVSKKDKEITAYHEAGHAVVSWYLPNYESVWQISIIPRGVAGGYTMHKRSENESYGLKSKMLEQIVVYLGGRVAEELIFNDISTGASNDIERASKIARDMVMKYGMSEKLGTIDFTINRAGTAVYSEKTAIEIDEEVRSIITELYEQAKNILNSHIDKLIEVAKALLEKEKIDEEEFKAIMSA